jgi:transposase
MSTDALPLPDLDALPDDMLLLKQLVRQLLAALQTQHAQTDKLQRRLDLLIRKLYGRSSEKLDPRQLPLFDVMAPEEQATVDADANSVATTNAESEEVVPRKKKKGHGRRPKPDTQEVIHVVHDLTEAEKQVLGGNGVLVPLASEFTERYEWKPSCLYLERHEQKKYVWRPSSADRAPSGLVRAEENQMITAAKPAWPIPGGIAGPGLLAWSIVSHHVDHLPFHRQEKISRRHGQWFSRQTTDGWSLRCAELLQPLYELLKCDVLASEVMWTDDTPVNVRDAFRKLQYQGRFWIYVGDECHASTVFAYTPNRKGEGPRKFLNGYRGYLHADAFAGYDHLYTQSSETILEVACWAHARRKFIESQSADPTRALTALAYIGQLYEVERPWTEKELTKNGTLDAWRQLPWEERAARILEARRARAAPVLHRFQEWLLVEAPKMIPKHPLRMAMNYILHNWTAFSRYVEDGRLSIDNNPAERSLRGIALGRNNWLFRGSDRGGRAAAIHFSLLASCQRHGLEPFAYLRHVLRELPLLGPSPSPDELQAFLPDRCRPT